MAILGHQLTANSTYEAMVASKPFAVSDETTGEYFVMPASGWITRIGMRNRDQAGSPKVVYAVWAMDGNGPTALLARTNTVTVGSTMTQREADVQSTTLVLAGQRLAIGGVVTGGQIRLAQNSGGSAPYVYLYRRNETGITAPTSPFLGTSGTLTRNGTWQSGVYLVYEPNVPPGAPTNVAVESITVSGSQVQTTTPEFAFRFIDADQTAGRPDAITKYRIQVTDTVTGTMVWPLSGQEGTAEFAATSTEQVVNATIRRRYPGATAGSSALVAGRSYRFNIQTADRAGVWGPWSADFAFIIADIGSVDVSAGTPTGKIDTVTSNITWTGKWLHGSGNATTHVQVQVLQNGALWQLGAEVAKVVANNGTISITPGEAGIGTLPRGQAFTYRMRGRTGGVWSGWSADRELRTNAPPNTPVPFDPADDEMVTSPPLLVAISSDPDADDILGVDVVHTFTITRPSPYIPLTLTYPTRDMIYDPLQSTVSLQLTGTDCPVVGEYVWEVMADDLSASAVQAGYGKSAASAPRSFTFQAGPAPTLTLPAATVGTVTPLYRFTLVNGPHTLVRAVVYQKGTTTRVWDSQIVPTASFDIVQPPGYLRNGGEYDVQVTVWNGSGQSGVSARRSFKVQFTAPDALEPMTLSLWAATRDPEPTAVLIGWPVTTLPAHEFVAYVVRRRLDGSDPDSAIILRRITDPAQSRWYDFHAPPGESLVYSVSQLRRGGTGPGTQIIESPVTEDAIQLDLSTVVIASARNPSGERIVLQYEPLNVDLDYRQNQQPYVTWGSEQKPTMVATSGTQEVVTLSGTIVGDDLGTRRVYAEAAKALHKAQAIVCYRDERNRVFGKITAQKVNLGDGLGKPDTISLTIEETNYTEGEA